MHHEEIIKMLSDKVIGLEQKLDDISQLLLKLCNKPTQGLTDWLTLEEASFVTTLGRTKLYELRRNGILAESSLTGKEKFIRKSSIEAALNKNEKELLNAPLIKPRKKQK